MPMSCKASPKRRQLRLARCLLGTVWLVIIVLCLLHREDFTLEGILTYSPRLPALAAALLLALFAVKSLSISCTAACCMPPAAFCFPSPWPSR